MSEVKQWYALKVFCNRTTDVDNELQNQGFESYMPVRKVAKSDAAGKIVERDQQIISGLLFVSLTVDQVAIVKRDFKGKVSFYTNPGNKESPAVIPDSQMSLFKMVIGECENLEFMGEDSPKWHVGQKVRVTDGSLKGAEGYICRIKGNRRLIVTVDGVCAVATGYIPSCFLLPIDP